MELPNPKKGDQGASNTCIYIQEQLGDKYLARFCLRIDKNTVHRSGLKWLKINSPMDNTLASSPENRQFLGVTSCSIEGTQSPSIAQMIYLEISHLDKTDFGDNEYNQHM